MPVKALALVFAFMLGSAAAQPGDPTLEVAMASPASYPEGPLFADGKLYYAEMGADRVRVVEDGVTRTFFEQRRCGPTAIAPYGEGFLVLCHIGARVVAVDAQGRESRRWFEDSAQHDLRDPNDAFADGHGGVYFSDPGVFSRRFEADGYVMHLSAAGVLRRVAGPLWYPNGVFVEHDVVFVNEHMTGRIRRYQAGASGALTPLEDFAVIDVETLPRRYRDLYAETGPDGLERGPHGELYVAIYGAGLILRFAPDGGLVESIETPARYVTNLAFEPGGGAYVTGSFDNLQPPFPGEVRFFARERLISAPDTPSSPP